MPSRPSSATLPNHGLTEAREGKSDKMPKLSEVPLAQQALAEVTREGGYFTSADFWRTLGEMLAEYDQGSDASEVAK